MKIGETRNKLTLIKVVGKAQCGHKTGLFNCSCGENKNAIISNVKRGVLKSCGCMLAAKGMSNTPEYRAWSAMIYRCHNKKSNGYPRYGARGIFVNDRWRSSFMHFLEDMGKRPSSNHSIDRIDNDDGYYKDNCRWATCEQQVNNKSTNLKFKGETATQASRRLGGEDSLVFGRLKNGWSKDVAFTLPVGSKR